MPVSVTHIKQRHAIESIVSGMCSDPRTSRAEAAFDGPY